MLRLVDEFRDKEHGADRQNVAGEVDEEVLRVAQIENRILLTLDKDFGELAFRTGVPAKCGIILLRVIPSSPEHITKVTIAALKTQTDWIGHFATVDETRIRLTPLPS